MSTPVLVLGLAKTGEETAAVLRREGVEVTVVEEHPSGSEHELRTHATGATVLEGAPAEGWAALVGRFGLVVPSPGVHPDHPALVAARAGGVPIRSEIELAAQRIGAPIVAVTGTNGKTTVTSLVAAMLEASGVRAVAAGNIGTPLVHYSGARAGRGECGIDVVVAEVSSFQLEFTERFHPRVAVLLAVADDHLDWHGSFAAYRAAKAKVFANQTGDDVLVYDSDDPVASSLAANAPARAIGVSLDPNRIGAARVIDGVLVDHEGAPIADVASLPRALPHDLSNSLAAATAALAVGATREGVRGALATYRTLPHRVALVGEARGVQFYDDSKATNPHAAAHAIAGFESVVLLAGGRNKAIDLDVLARDVHRIRAVVAFGEAAPEVERAFAGKRPVVRADSMRAVVRAGAAEAEPGDVVLLSPACASWDWYEGGYEARGDDFAAEVQQLIRELDDTDAEETR